MSSTEVGWERNGPSEVLTVGERDRVYQLGVRETNWNEAHLNPRSQSALLLLIFDVFSSILGKNQSKGKDTDPQIDTSVPYIEFNCSPENKL